MNIATLVKQINGAAPKYRIGALQQLRSKLHGKRPGIKKIFATRTSSQSAEHEYAFHHGGRTELQFNIGMELRDRRRWWRHGVAFSFETSQRLPDPMILRPKVCRFNEWVRANAGELRAFKMWHREGSAPSEDRSPSEIPEVLITKKAFVFLGTRVPEEDLDVQRILQNFDRMYPLYEHVESESSRVFESTPFRVPEEVSESSTYSEGGVERILVNRYERDTRAREECIRRYGVKCVLCGFDFLATYGEVMQGFIHVHHLRPLSDAGANYQIDPNRGMHFTPDYPTSCGWPVRLPRRCWTISE